MAAPVAIPLRALVGGGLPSWPGLPPDLTQPLVATALGSAPVAQGPVRLFGTAALLCRYPPAAAAPHGLAVWYVRGTADLIEIAEPALTAPVPELIGPPDAQVDSLLGSNLVQLVYAGRGLAIHINGATGRPHRLYGFERAPLAQFLTGPLRTIEVRSVPC